MYCNVSVNRLESVIFILKMSVCHLRSELTHPSVLLITLSLSSGESERCVMSTDSGWVVPLNQYVKWQGCVCARQTVLQYYTKM